MCYILETLLLAMFFASFSVVVETSTTTNCSMYLAKSRLQGLGVFAGRPYEKGTYTEEDLSLQIGLSELPDDFFTAWQLGYYVYGGYSNHEAVVFGPTMIYNHDDNSNLRFNLKPIWNWHYFMLTVVGLGAVLYFFYLDPTFNIEKPIYAGCIFGILIYVFPMPLLFNAGQHKVGYSLGPMFNFEVVRSVEVGSELFSKYGGNWFQDRNITKTHAQVQGSVYSLDELERIGVCLSNTYVAPSRIPNAGRGVFVHSDVLQGRVIEVTPALVHHKLKVADTSSLLINYIIASSESNVTLLPFGRIGLANHGGLHANAVIEWYFWDDDRSVLNKSPDQLYLSPAAEISLAYRAIVDIHEGHEVTIDYGDNWQSLWEAYRNQSSTSQFRANIGAPKDFFPAHWRSTTEN